MAAIIHKKITFMDSNLKDSNLKDSKNALESKPKVGAILSGGNIDVTMLNVIIEKGLLKSDRKMKFEVILIDKPGSLQKLTEILTKEGANIVFINYSRISARLQYGDAIVEMELEVKGREHKENVIKILTQHGYEFSEVL